MKYLKDEIINSNNDYPKEENKPEHKLKVQVLRTPLKKEPTDNIAKSIALKNALKKSQKNYIITKHIRKVIKNVLMKKRR